MLLNCASKKEHIPEIKQFIYSVKERVWSAQSAMPFKQISKLMIVHIVASNIFNLNFLLIQNLEQDCQTQKTPYILYVGLLLTTIRFYTYSQMNMFS